MREVRLPRPQLVAPTRVQSHVVAGNTTSAPGFLQIDDSRYLDREGTYTFHGTLAEIYLACGDRPTTASAVRKRLQLELPVETIEEIFEEFRTRGLMFRDGSFALALALPAVPGR
jgi:hypothetical protein